ncbi:MAG TPA: phosphatase PAP2 family protein [Gemmatimonadales bacterium]|jgi:membrane-associated phospholipid phosphatase
MPTRAALAAAVLLLSPPPASAQAHLVPSAVEPATQSGSLVSRRVLTVAGLLFAGALAGDQELREEAQESRDGLTNSAARMGNTFGDMRFIVPALAAAYVAGDIAGSSGVKTTALQAGIAAALATAVTGALKFAAGRTRPYAARSSFDFHPFSGAKSFPSGHTSVAFALATAVADRTHDGWSDYLLYGAATLTALSRINDNRHWTSDVLVGALVGHLSARWVARRLPLPVTPAGLSISLRF